MPASIQNFASTALTKPITVNVGQEVEYVELEAKKAALLEALQKTPPPVLVFCRRTSDVDELYLYLLVQGVHACSLHPGKTQQERNEAVKQFRKGQRDVMVATDIISKGLDFPGVQHVICYDMPREIEDYVHRIGRTGRMGGVKGIATAFIDRTCSVTILLDLKALLQEAEQPIPGFMKQIEPDVGGADEEIEDKTGVKGCSFCGGLGHRIKNCPKAAKKRMREINDSIRRSEISGTY
eukprot:CAMPEP_0168521582 /NCGR_PEP_ID=MMETSP0405-20121227/8756_1 /TAXON_ID=498012 /ORGANISM="Trichosphaerium sp, Strain Am-I-7 wt" /LENGTH=237 /DNA_ID=CAMNT_0008542857 /DNA_START=27 /DNA_END=740 /DNA_ORIENTATION=-